MYSSLTFFFFGPQGLPQNELRLESVIKLLKQIISIYPSIYIYRHIYIYTHIYSWGFPGGSVVKNLPTNAGDAGLIPGSVRSPGEGNGNPLQYSCLGNPMDRGVWWATVCGVTKSQTQLSMHAHTYIHTRAYRKYFFVFLF